MLTLANIRDYIKTIFTDTENFYIGKLDNKKDKSIGIYDLKTSKDKPYIALGGIDNTNYQVKPISILIHWNKNANETEIASNKLYNALLCQTPTINDIDVFYIEMLVNRAISVDTDDKGIYEYVIECKFYYKK